MTVTPDTSTFVLPLTSESDILWRFPLRSPEVGTRVPVPEVLLDSVRWDSKEEGGEPYTSSKNDSGFELSIMSNRCVTVYTI